jgi:hypothetical protein
VATGLLLGEVGQSLSAATGNLIAKMVVPELVRGAVLSFAARRLDRTIASSSYDEVVLGRVLVAPEELLYFFESDPSVLVNVHCLENPCMNRLHFF